MTKPDSGAGERRSAVPRSSRRYRPREAEFKDGECRGDQRPRRRQAMSHGMLLLIETLGQRVDVFAARRWFAATPPLTCSCSCSTWYRVAWLRPQALYAKVPN